MARFWWALLVVALLGITGAYVWDTARRGSHAGDLPVLGSVADFKLTDQSGQNVSRKDYAGKIWIADFIYTTCPDQCPMMTRRMQVIQGLVPEESGVQLVSISVDPEQDTPRVLSDYAGKYHANTKRWRFLTGSSEAVAAFTAQMKIAILRVEGKPEIDHSDRLILIDPAGQIRGYYSGTDDKAVQQLVKDVSRLADSRS